MNSVAEAIKKIFTAFNKTQHYCVAYSGGIDSHVLLHALVQHKPASAQLRAIHIHHGLQIVADEWVEHCAEQTCALNVPLEIKYVDAKAAKGKSPEASAREARYAALAEMMTEGEVLLTAHNQNDQAETVFLQLLRGAGVKGLAAMPAQTEFNSGILYRPLLNISRAEIAEYAVEQQLSWVEDPSNDNTHYDRNFLRQKIMPLLAERWPSFAQTVARSAQHCAEASALIEEVAEQDLVNMTELSVDLTLSPSLCAEATALIEELAEQDFIKVTESNLNLSPSLPLEDNKATFSVSPDLIPGPFLHSREATAQMAVQPETLVENHNHPLPIKALLNLTIARQRQVIRHWLVQQRFPVPSTTQMESLFRDLIHAAEDKRPLMQWPGVEIRRFKGYLFAMSPLSPFDNSLEIEWDGRTPLLLPVDLGVLNPDDPRLLSIKSTLATTKSCIIRFRRGGETLRIPERKGTHDLKKLFQEWGVLPWRRDRVPLMHINGEMVLVLLLSADCFPRSLRGNNQKGQY